VELLLIFVFFNASQDRLVCNTRLLEKCSEVLDAEMPVWTAMGLTRARLMLHENLLAAIGTITVSSPVAIPTYVAVGVSHVITILFVEYVIGNL